MVIGPSFSRVRMREAVGSLPGASSAASPIPRMPGLARQTPRISVTFEATSVAKRSLGRSDLKPFAAWDEGRPETELNFKLHRQATDKIVAFRPTPQSSLRHFSRVRFPPKADFRAVHFCPAKKRKLSRFLVCEGAGRCPGSQGVNFHTPPAWSGERTRRASGFDKPASAHVRHRSRVLCEPRHHRRLRPRWQWVSGPSRGCR